MLAQLRISLVIIGGRVAIINNWKWAMLRCCDGVQQFYLAMMRRDGIVGAVSIHRFMNGDTHEETIISMERARVIGLAYAGICMMSDLDMSQSGNCCCISFSFLLYLFFFSFSFSICAVFVLYFFTVPGWWRIMGYPASWLCGTGGTGGAGGSVEVEFCWYESVGDVLWYRTDSTSV